MHFLNLSQFFNEMRKNEEESFLSSVKCRIRTVVLWSSLYTVPPYYLMYALCTGEFVLKIVCTHPVSVSAAQHIVWLRVETQVG